MRRYAWLIFLLVVMAEIVCLLADDQGGDGKKLYSAGPYVFSVQEVSWKRDQIQLQVKGVLISGNSADQEVTEGSIVKVYGHPKPLEELRSKDYASYLKSKGIRYTLSAKRIEVTGYQRNLAYYIGKIRRMLRRRIETIFRADSPMVKALIYGDREEITSEMKEIFSETGMSHIIAISGFHIGMIAVLSVKLFKRLPAKIRQLMAMGLVLSFVLITGARPSAVRAGIFFCVGLIAVWLRREYDLISTTLVTASALMAWNPYIIYDRGFVLSFAGVLSIGLFYPLSVRFFSNLPFPAFVTNLLALTLAVQILVLPVSYYYFGRISLISVVANLVSVPLISLIYPLLFAAMAGYGLPIVGEWFREVSVTGLRIFLRVNELLSDLPISCLDFERRSLMITIVMYIGIAIGYMVVWKKMMRENENHATGFETTY